MIYDHIQLPEGWEWKKLKYVSSYNDESLTETTDPSYEFKYIEIADVSLSSGISNVTHINFSEAPSRARRIVKKGDILVSTVRTYLKAIANVVDDSPNLIASTGFCVVRANEYIDPDYLGWVIKSDVFVDEVVSQSVGVSYPAINAPTLMDIKIPIPPIEIQMKIHEFLKDRANRLEQLSGKSAPNENQDALSRLNNAILDYRASLIFNCVLGRIEGMK
jgi:type I restriction enzyme, S subunit